jgi:uncharacterized protein YukE
MSSTIQLATQVGTIHQKYSAVHGALFGRTSYRLFLSALAGRQGAAYRKSATSLMHLEQELSDLRGDLETQDDGPSHRWGGKLLPDTLTEYAVALKECIGTLKRICDRLAEDESSYRTTSAGEASEFYRDKVEYDDRKSHLERLGTKLSKLFSNYQSPRGWGQNRGRGRGRTGD